MATGAIVVVLGAFLLVSPLGDPFLLLSFDIPFLFAPTAPTNNIVVIKFDGATLRDSRVNGGTTLRESSPPRSAYARVLNELAADRAERVIFDVHLQGKTKPEEDEALAEAIRSYGKVVLAADISVTTQGLVRVTGPLEPDRIFLRSPESRVGFMGVDPGAYPDFVVRDFPMGGTNMPSLAVAISQALGLKVNPPTLENPRQLVYYRDGPGAFQSVRFEDVLDTNRTKGSFSNKVVFIGSSVRVPFAGEKDDIFSTPLTRWTPNHDRMRGVDLHAIALLNLKNGDLLRRWGEWKELLVLLATGIGATLLFSRLRPSRGLAWAGGSALVITIASILIVWTARVWFDWALIPFVQIPMAWGVAAWFRPPEVEPDQYEFLKEIASGSFGEVWLARSTPTGVLRAIKRVYRDRFPESSLYEAEFEGLKNFDRSGLVHPNWVRVLHVSKNDAAGYFYYVMELADDMILGPEIQPDKYVPKTLGNVLIEQAWLPGPEVISTGIKIADALAALHKLEMVHRDVKPSNIIFVRGVPKLADIGLISNTGSPHSSAGTIGFAPETELGTPSADICCLGKTLYKAATGCPPEKYPSLPSDLEKRADAREVVKLMKVLERACDVAEATRYNSAEEFKDDLIRLRFR